MKPTIEDVAKLAGVSKATVSLVLNRRGSSVAISESTKRKVLQASEQLGYKPHRLARAFATGRSHAIGIIAIHPEYLFASDYSALVMRGVASVAHERGYNLMIFDEELITKQDLPTSYSDLIAQRHVDGILIVPPDRSDRRVLTKIKELEDREMPFAFLWRKPPEIKASCVSVDNVDGGRKAVEYLIQLGHRRIAFITLGRESLSSQERLEGYRLALETHGIRFDPQLVKHYGYYSERDEKIIDEKIIDELLSMADPPTALFAGYDPLAIGAINTLHRKGKRIPQDLSVIGFGDIMMAPYCHPPLTTLKEPMEEIGQKTALLLIDQIENQGQISEPQTIILKPQLVVRDSCGPAPRQGAIEP